MTDHDGVLVPLRIVEQRVLQALTDASAEFTKDTTRVPRVLWLAELLLLCGTRRGATGFQVTTFFIYKYLFELPIMINLFAIEFF